MFSFTCTIVALVFLLFLFILVNFQFIKQYVRMILMLNRLPNAKQRKFLLGHGLIFFGLSLADALNVALPWLKSMPPLAAIFLGPLYGVVHISSPDIIEATISSTKNLEKAVIYKFFSRWLVEGLLTSKDSKWHIRRKIITPAFHFSILLEFVSVFNKETKHFLTQLKKHEVNQGINLSPLISDFTLLTMSETSMGIKLDLNTGSGKEYKNAVHQIGKILFERFITAWYWTQTCFEISSLGKVEAKVLRTLHGFTTTIIKRRSENFQTFDEKFDNSYKKRKHPLLDILLNAKFKHNSIDDDGIREEVDTFMFEGHDTTAMCMNFTTMLLANHKDIQEEVYHEIVSILGPHLDNEPTYGQLQEMTLLEGCIKESLRLYPPVPLLGRVASEDIPTKYGTIPKGTTCFAHLYYLHRNEEHWPNAEVFDPSRHLPENSVGRHPFAFIPFSAGPRNCIGQKFAMLEIKAFFCGLLREYQLEPIDTPENIVLVEDMVLRPRDGITVKLIPR